MPAPSPLEGLVGALMASRSGVTGAIPAWADQWGDPLDGWEQRSWTVPDPWRYPSPSGLEEALARQGERVKARPEEYATIFATEPARRLLSEAARISQADLSQGSTASPTRSFLLEFEWYASTCLTRTPAAAAVRRFAPDVLERFTPLLPEVRLAFLGLPATMSLLASRVRWAPIVSVRGPASEFGQASDDRGALARRAFLQDSWRTDSIAAVVWLEFLWAARSGLWLHTCHAPRCTQAFLARDGRAHYCCHHTSPPWATEKAALAYARWRQRRPEGEASTWAAWRDRVAAPTRTSDRG